MGSGCFRGTFWTGSGTRAKTFDWPSSSGSNGLICIHPQGQRGKTSAVTAEGRVYVGHFGTFVELRAKCARNAVHVRHFCTVRRCLVIFVLVGALKSVLRACRGLSSQPGPVRQGYIGRRHDGGHLSSLPVRNPESMRRLHGYDHTQ